MNTADALSKAIQHHQAGRLSEAEALYRQILTHDPAIADAIHLLGVIAKQTGHSDDAIELISCAIRLKPDMVDAHSNLGAALREAKKFDAAVAAYRRAIQLNPNHAGSYNNLGNALKDQDKLDESIAAYQRAIELVPDYGEAHSNLGNALKRIGQFDRAVSECRRAVELLPKSAQAHYNLGHAQYATGLVAESIQSYDRAVALDPKLPDAHLNLALSLLQMEDYRRGWEEYEWRWKVHREDRPPEFPKPRWMGEQLNNRTILVHAEQGYGDIIHFARYLPLVHARGGKILLGSHSGVARLLQSIPGIDRIAGSPVNLPPYDVQCPLPGLPFSMHLAGPEDIPWTGPYLKSDPNLKSKFTDAITQAHGKFKVGLIWSGRPDPPGRSIPLSMLAPLANPKIQFYSLQVNQGSAEAQSPPIGMEMIDVTSRITDFADTAALIDQLDLIISIDTAAAQLAGALGKPVWTLLKRIPDWRWLLDRSDSPWYPTMRLFRQQTDGDWQPVISDVAAALQAQL
jgi:Tfp pilus assembly protein PilF